MLCTKCFKNEGLLIEAARLSLGDPVLCSICGSSEGQAISDDTAHELLIRFFGHGSESLVVAGHVPVYKLTADRGFMSGKFESPLEDDYQLLLAHYGLGVFHNAPAEWRMGMTDHYHELSGSYTEALETLDQIIRVATLRVIPAGSKLYRIRTNVRASVGLATSYDAPPHEIKRKAGRYDDTDFPVLYAAFDIETCIHECRCTVIDEIALATLHTVRELTVVDFQDLHEPPPDTPFQCIGHFIYGLSVATEDEYPKCRMLARRMLELGVDGFTYRSFFSSVKSDDLTNVALFGYPIRDGKISVTSLNRIKIDRIDYGFSLGPVMHNDEA
jgi:RES domain